MLYDDRMPASTKRIVRFTAAVILCLSLPTMIAGFHLRNDLVVLSDSTGRAAFSVALVMSDGQTHESVGRTIRFGLALEVVGALMLTSSSVLLWTTRPRGCGANANSPSAK